MPQLSRGLGTDPFGSDATDCWQRTSVDRAVARRPSLTGSVDTTCVLSVLSRESNIILHVYGQKGPADVQLHRQPVTNDVMWWMGRCTKGKHRHRQTVSFFNRRQGLKWANQIGVEREGGGVRSQWSRISPNQVSSLAVRKA